MSQSQLKPPRSVLSRFCKQKKSHRQIAKILNVAPSTVGWWLQQYGLQTVGTARNHSSRKPKCKLCGETQAHKFYYGRKTLCCLCWSKTQTDSFRANRRARRVTLKYAAVQAKGGCCQKCGYRKNLAALQFHHPDRALKHENWQSLFRLSAQSSKHIATLAAQLENCELLCANCHAEVHHPHTAMPMCVAGKDLVYLSQWVGELRKLFHVSTDGAT